MTAEVVDENVPIVANDATRISNGVQPQAPQATDTCRLAAIRYLREGMSDGVFVIDDEGVCLAKYRSYLSGGGQPGTGDAFLKHLFDNSYNPSKVERLRLARTDGEFDAFPKDPALSSFDRSDRIFVALALRSTLDSSIANAVDSDYRNHAEALAAAGVKVTELCPVRVRSAMKRRRRRTRAPRRVR